MVCYEEIMERLTITNNRDLEDDLALGSIIWMR